VTAATRDRLVFLLCLVVGAALVLALTRISDVWVGKLESPWRDQVMAPYRAAALSAAYLLLLALGFVASRAAWRWPLLLFVGAFLASLSFHLRAYAGLRVFAVYAFLAAFGLFPAYLGVALRRMRQRMRAARFAAAQKKAAGF